MALCARCKSRKHFERTGKHPRLSRARTSKVWARGMKVCSLKHSPRRSSLLSRASANARNCDHSGSERTWPRIQHGHHAFPAVPLHTGVRTRRVHLFANGTEARQGVSPLYMKIGQGFFVKFTCGSVKPLSQVNGNLIPPVIYFKCVGSPRMHEKC